MIKGIPEKLIGFDLLDYELDGSEVLEIIKDMPQKINLPITRTPSSNEVRNAKIRAIRYPEREVPPLNKEVIEVLYYSVQEMVKIFNGRKKSYSISQYDVELFIHSDYDIVRVAFCSKIENWLDGPGDEPGVTLYFTLSSHELLKKYYMR